jgi:hypothetical protein
MATTPGGLPYPIGTDKVVDGDNAIEALARALDPRIIKAGAWTPYTPTWTASSTAPNVGAGTLRGRFVQHGYTVTFQMEMVPGTGFSNGTGGAWAWALPPSLPAAAGVIQGVAGRVLHAGKVVPVTGQLLPSGTSISSVVDAAGVILQPSYAFALNDQLQLWGTYETSAAFVP